MDGFPERLLYPDGYDYKCERKFRDFGFIKPLQIEDMIVLVKQSYRGFHDLKLQDYFLTDPEVLDYRMQIVEDLVNNPALYEVFVKAIPMLQNVVDMRQTMDRMFTVESALTSVRYLESYQEVVELFASGLKEAALHSVGLGRLRAAVLAIYEGEEYANLTKELATVEVRFGDLKSLTIGINLDGDMSVQEAGIASVDTKPFHAGTLMEKLLKKDPEKTNSLMSPIYPLQRGLHGEELKALNYSIQSALNSIYAKAVKSFGPVVRNYFNVNTAVFTSLLDDIRFLTAGVKFILSMKEKGFVMCRPVIAPVEEKRCELEGVYNPILADKLIEKTVVGNAFSYDENGRFYLVTGPNHGGKSIFAYSVGMCQALFQLGFFVPAKSAVLSPVTGIYTHFPSSDEGNYGKGRLESECARLAAIMEQLTETDLLLMDESFSSTSGLEASYIATEVITGIGVIGCGGLFVTHIHDLPQKLAIYNSHPQNRGKIDNLVALMENKENGTRSYRIARTTPDGLSYAKDIAGRYGLDLEGILARSAK